MSGVFTRVAEDIYKMCYTSKHIWFLSTNCTNHRTTYIFSCWLFCVYTKYNDDNKITSYYYRIRLIITCHTKHISRMLNMPSHLRHRNKVHMDKTTHIFYKYICFFTLFDGRWLLNGGNSCRPKMRHIVYDERLSMRLTYGL